MAKTTTLKKKDGTLIYPQTTSGIVIYNGGNVKDELDSINGKLNYNKGYFETSEALILAHPTAEAGSYAIVGETDSTWVWDTENNGSWKDSGNQQAPVSSVNGKDGVVILNGGDINSTINVNGEDKTESITNHLQLHQTAIEILDNEVNGEDGIDERLTQAELDILGKQPLLEERELFGSAYTSPATYGVFTRTYSPANDGTVTTTNIQKNIETLVFENRFVYDTTSEIQQGNPISLNLRITRTGTGNATPSLLRLVAYKIDHITLEETTFFEVSDTKIITNGQYTNINGVAEHSVQMTPEDVLVMKLYCKTDVATHDVSVIISEALPLTFNRTQQAVNMNNGQIVNISDVEGQTSADAINNLNTRLLVIESQIEIVDELPTDLTYDSKIVEIFSTKKMYLGQVEEGVLNWLEVKDVANKNNYYTKTEIDTLIGDIETLLGEI